MELVEAVTQAVGTRRVHQEPCELLDTVPAVEAVLLLLLQRRPTLELEPQQAVQDRGVAVGPAILEEPRHHAAQDAHGALGPLGIAAEPEQIVGGPAQEVASDPAQMHLAHAGAQDADLLALQCGCGDPQVLAAEAVGQRRRRGLAGEADHAAGHDR